MILELEPYQQTARTWLMAQPTAAALFMEMSLGKTAIVLSAIEEMLREAQILRALVVAPKAVARINWPAEAQKWEQFRWMRIVDLSTPEGLRKWRQKEGEIFVTNYEQLHKIADDEDWPVDLIVLDELTKVKAPSSKRGRKLWGRLLKEKIYRRWGLTGTPRPNSLLELFAQYRILDDGRRLGRSFDHYKHTYFFPTDYMQYKWEPFPTSEARILDRVKDITLTMKASEFLNLPDTETIELEVDLPDDAREVYDTLEKDLIVQLERAEIVALSAGVLVQKLLQVSGGAVYDKSEERTWHAVHTAKLDALKAYCLENDEPMIIAWHFRHEQERIKAMLGAEAVCYEDGGPDVIDRWNAGKIRWLLTHPAAMGHGLNLQDGGRTLVRYSQNHSRELHDQLAGRLRRRGQDQTLRVVNIIARDTVDQAVNAALATKGSEQAGLMQTLVNYRLQLGLK